MSIVPGGRYSVAPRVASRFPFSCFLPLDPYSPARPDLSVSPIAPSQSMLNRMSPELTLIRLYTLRSPRDAKGTVRDDIIVVDIIVILNRPRIVLLVPDSNRLSYASSVPIMAAVNEPLSPKCFYLSSVSSADATLDPWETDLRDLARACLSATSPALQRLLSALYTHEIISGHLLAIYFETAPPLIWGRGIIHPKPTKKVEDVIESMLQVLEDIFDSHGQGYVNDVPPSTSS